jgi:hypothetical protein
MRRRIRGAAGVSAGLAVGLLIAGCTSEEPSTQLGAATASPTAATPTSVSPTSARPLTTTTTSASAEDKAFDEAETAFRDYLDLQGELIHRPRNATLLRRLQRSATGDELNESRKLFTYLADHDLRGKGHFDLTSVKRTSANVNADPPTVQLRACIDGSPIDIVNGSGKSISHLSLSDYKVKLVRSEDKTWLVSRWKGKTVKKC